MRSVARAFLGIGAWIRGVAMAFFALVVAGAALGQAERVADGEEREYIRVSTDPAGQLTALQTSIVSFSGPAADGSDVRVDLVSAVHVGDAAYYAELNARFRDYEAVLYELIAPTGTRVPAGGGGHGGFVSSTQVALTRLLDLEFQLDEVDYTPANFVHADLSPQEFAQSMAERGESVSQYIVKMFAAAMSEQAKDPYGLRDIGLLAALFSSDRARLLKEQFALVMLDMDTFTEIIEGGDGSTIVAARNGRVIEVLEERIQRGDRRLAIFYGAAHMPDMAMRLRSELGLERDRSAWIDAWNLR